MGASLSILLYRPIYREVPELLKWRSFFHSLRLDEVDVGRLFRVFRRIDTSMKGRIYIVDMLMFLDADRNRFTERVLSMFDKDNSGYIDFKEFIVTDLHRKALDVQELIQILQDVYGANFTANPNASRILTSIHELHTNSSGKIDVALFQEFCKTHPSLLYPAFMMQRRIKNRIVGRRFWEMLSKRRLELLRSRNISEMDLLEMQRTNLDLFVEGDRDNNNNNNHYNHSPKRPSLNGQGAPIRANDVSPDGGKKQRRQSEVANAQHERRRSFASDDENNGNHHRRDVGAFHDGDHALLDHHDEHGHSSGIKQRRRGSQEGNNHDTRKSIGGNNHGNYHDVITREVTKDTYIDSRKSSTASEVRKKSTASSTADYYKAGLVTDLLNEGSDGSISPKSSKSGKSSKSAKSAKSAKSGNGVKHPRLSHNHDNDHNNTNTNNERTPATQKKGHHNHNHKHHNGHGNSGGDAHQGKGHPAHSQPTTPTSASRTNHANAVAGYRSDNNGDRPNTGAGRHKPPHKSKDTGLLSPVSNNTHTKKPTTSHGKRNTVAGQVTVLVSGQAPGEYKRPLVGRSTDIV